MLEELLRGAVEQRPAQAFAPPHDVDELAFLERPQHAGRADAADLLDLRPADRLAVRDDREHLQGRAREATALRHGVEPLEHTRILRAGQELVAAGDLVDLESAARGIVLRA